MNRKIKFRGKRPEGGEWVYGWYVNKTPEKHQIVASGVTFPILVIPETVGQFTGLLDKNGKEIYEGDIVRCCYSCYFETKEIAFIKKEAMFNTPSIFYDDDGNYAPCEEYFVEIVGNIHDDNPELLTNK